MLYNNEMRARVFLLALLAIGAISLALTYFSYEHQKSPTGQAARGVLSEERERWRTRLDTASAAQVYEEFKRSYTDQPFRLQHSAVHMIGELLYEKLGIEGLAVCDGMFAFGCYHSFFGKAVSGHGLKKITELDRACIEKFGSMSSGCQHGIGHGLLEYLGHQNLLTALHKCPLTTWQEPLSGCVQGVFMEYNIPIVLEGEARLELRKPGTSPYEPCNTIVPPLFQPSCYHELVEWWSHVYSRDFQMIIKLCEEIPEMQYQEPCYLALGNIAASTSDYRIEKVIEVCDSILDRGGNSHCRIGAALRISNVGDEKLARELCKSLDPIFQKKCP